MTDATGPTATDPAPASFASADALGSEHRQRRAAIENDPSLTPIGRGQRLGALDVEHAQRLEAVKVADRQALAEANAARWVAAFGTIDQDHAQRATADARAMQLASPEEAGAALDRAQLLGDETLARAIGEHAYNAVRSSPLAAIRPCPWGRVLDAYRSTRPAADAALAEMLPTANPRRSALNRRLNLEMRATG
jgi:hypothetical protein